MTWICRAPVSIPASERLFFTDTTFRKPRFDEIVDARSIYFRRSKLTRDFSNFFFFFTDSFGVPGTYVKNEREISNEFFELFRYFSTRVFIAYGKGTTRLRKSFRFATDISRNCISGPRYVREIQVQRCSGKMGAPEAVKLYGTFFVLFRIYEAFFTSLDAPRKLTAPI